MPHGAPDWYKYRRDSATHPVDDLAELAARLGSIHTFDRRGDVVTLETFEQGLGRWTSSLLGDDAAATVSPTTYRTGGYSAKLISGTGEAPTATMAIYHATPVLSPHGFEYSFTVDPDAVSITAYALIFTPTHAIRTRIRYTVATGNLDCLVGLDTWQSVATGLDLDTRTGLFHILKWVIDPDTRYYVRCILDAAVYDMATIPCYAPASAIATHILFQVELNGDGTTSATIYLDNVIITQDEP